METQNCTIVKHLYLMPYVQHCCSQFQPFSPISHLAVLMRVSLLLFLLWHQTPFPIPWFCNAASSISVSSPTLFTPSPLAHLYLSPTRFLSPHFLSPHSSHAFFSPSSLTSPHVFFPPFLSPSPLPLLLWQPEPLVIGASSELPDWDKLINL